ncbi:MAG: lipase family protein [Gammaproteobacteria bacterium]
MSETFFEDVEFAKKPPVKRAAYSDRTAWLMAEISKLVYERFPSETNANEESIIEKSFEKVDFEVLEYWSKGGTQAILVRKPPVDTSDGMLVLAFRGTELKETRDVMVDARLPLIPFEGGGKVHQGFIEAFQQVEIPIRQSLEKYNNKGQFPLYITGHSLGGALALVATRVFGSDGSGATYTFGCPRVADEAFFIPIKTPVYRVVNAGDGVARMPLGYSLTILLSLLRLIPINGTHWLSKIFLRLISGYTHYGNLIFISGSGNDVTMRMSPDIFWQVPYVVIRWLTTLGTALLKDHSMDEYRQKLLAYAKKRNS